MDLSTGQFIFHDFSNTVLPKLRRNNGVCWAIRVIATVATLFFS